MAIGTKKPVAEETADVGAAKHITQLLPQQASPHPLHAGQIAASPALAIKQPNRSNAASAQLLQQQQQEDLASYLAGHRSQVQQEQQQQLENAGHDSSKRRRVAAGLLSRSLHTGGASACGSSRKPCSSSSSRHISLRTYATTPGLLQPQPRRHGAEIAFSEQHELPLRQIFGTARGTGPACSRMLQPASEQTGALKASEVVAPLPSRQDAPRFRPALVAERQPAAEEQQEPSKSGGSMQGGLLDPAAGSGLPSRTPKRKRSPRLPVDCFLEKDGAMDLAAAFNLLSTAEAAPVPADSQPQGSQARVATDPTCAPQRGQASCTAQHLHQQEQQGDKAHSRNEGGERGQRQLELAEHLDFETFRLFDSLWLGPRQGKGSPSQGSIGPPGLFSGWLHYLVKGTSS
ncbi:hypothetical protein N2152v2_006711 [Parachlorella kessleri]